MLAPSKRTRFDHEYFRRYYLDAVSRSVAESDVQDIADFVLSYARRLCRPVDSVIDFCCGVGFWRSCIKRRRRAATFLGVETSAHAHRQYGWSRGSVTDFRSGETHDLVFARACCSTCVPGTRRGRFTRLHATPEA